MNNPPSDYLNKKKSFWLILSITFFVLFLVLLILIAIFILPKMGISINSTFGFLKNNIADKIEINKTQDNRIARLIDGVKVRPGEENIYPVAVIIDNLKEARPAAGIANANIVYEIEAEGRITRYLALFADYKNIERIGPVRSARPYFVDFAQEYSALFTHCGGSPEAIVKIAKDNILDLNEFYNGNYFWRDEKKDSPHNVYITGESINNYLQKKELSFGKFLSWNFKDDLPLENRTSTNKIIINYKMEDYKVEWWYDKEKNEYQRYLGGIKYQDEDKNNLFAKNIIVQFNATEEIDKELRLKIATTGEGRAIICLDGQCEEGKWKKRDKYARTRYYNQNDEEISFNAGMIWINVVRPEYEVKY